jgi:hypothetical protein
MRYKVTYLESYLFHCYAADGLDAHREAGRLIRNAGYYKEGLEDEITVKEDPQT